MGRRKRIHSEDYDDSLEQRFFSKQRKLNHNENGDGNGNNNNETNTTKPSSSQHLSPQERELKRQKKKAKKLRQKEKKLAALKAEEKEKDKEHKRISVAVAVATEKEKEKEKEKDENKTSTKKKKKKKQIQDKHPNESSTTTSSSSSTTTGKWITINKGVKYCDFLLGKGPMIQDRTQIRVKYTLRAHNKQGKIIDAAANFGFKFGKGEVIVGWELGLKGMKQGGIRHIIVPPNAGYGTRDIGGGSGAMLYFEVTLLKC